MLKVTQILLIKAALCETIARFLLKLALCCCRRSGMVHYKVIKHKNGDEI
jgi:hypothetical protein